MKKISVFFVLAVMTLTGLSAQNSSRSFDVRDFTGIKVGGNYVVELTCADEYSVEVQAPSEIIPNVEVNVTDSLLTVSIKDHPRKFNPGKTKTDFILRVSMPEIYTINLSGAAKLQSEACFIQPDKEITIECSGASVIDGLCLQVKEADLDISGVSKVTMNIEAVKTEVEQSGASKVTLFGKSMIGSLEMSATAGFQGKKFCFDSLELEQTGVSRSEIWVLHNFEIGLSGTAHCDYLPEPDIHLNVENVSGGASLRKIKE